MLLHFHWLLPQFCLWLLVYCVCLQSDTDEGDTSRSRDTAELMDLSQASQRQPNLASNRMKNKGIEFKRDSPSSSFGPRRKKKRKRSKRLISPHLHHSIHPSSVPVQIPIFPSPWRRMQWKRIFSKKNYLYCLKSKYV